MAAFLPFEKYYSELNKITQKSKNVSQCAFLKCVVISGGMCENRKENWWAMHINRQQGTSILSPNLDRYLLLDYRCLQGVVAYIAEIQWHSA